MSIVIIGAHPDDPESGCGGLAIKAARHGYRVVFLYLTSGDLYGHVPKGRSISEVREDEARAACAVCGAEPLFLTGN